MTTPTLDTLPVVRPHSARERTLIETFLRSRLPHGTRGDVHISPPAYVTAQNALPDCDPSYRGHHDTGWWLVEVTSAAAMTPAEIMDLGAEPRIILFVGIEDRDDRAEMIMRVPPQAYTTNAEPVVVRYSDNPGLPPVSVTPTWVRHLNRGTQE